MGDKATISGQFGGIDDQTKVRGRNTKVASGKYMIRIATGLNQIQHSGRMIYTFWDGDTTNNSTDVCRWIWNHHHVPGHEGRFFGLYTPDSGVRASGQAIQLTIAGDTTTKIIDYSAAGVTAPAYPSGSRAFNMATTDAVSNTTACSFGSLTANGPIIESGMFYEARQLSADPTNAREYLPDEQFAQGADIVTGAVGGSLNVTNTYRVNLLHAWARMRPQICWSAHGVGADYLTLTSTDQRFIFNTTIGENGTAISETGPGITFPARYAGSGLNTSVNAAVYVWARMNGTTDNGTLSFSHRQSGGGGMTALAALTNGPTINGTTWQWYPAVNTTPATIKLWTNLAYDRVVLTASTGTTDELQIGAFAIFVQPSTTIT